MIGAPIVAISRDVGARCAIITTSSSNHERPSCWGVRGVKQVFDPYFPRASAHDATQLT